MLMGTAIGGIFRRDAPADSTAADRLTWGAEPVTGTLREQRYRANAQILVLSLPILHWADVGGGSVIWRESSSLGTGVLRFLEFSGFSSPEHAGGLNRLGFLRELSRVTENGASESLYFGLMTASPEETAEEARRALHPTAKGVTYTTIDGRITKGSVETVVAHFIAPAQWSAKSRNELVERARMALSASSPKPPEFDTRGVEARPFLQVLADILRQRDRADSHFVYNGRLYHLWLEKSADPKAAAYFRKRGLVSAGAQVVRAAARLRREAGGRESDFRVWVDEQATQPIPLRIEYQAKSYLRLIFEAE